MSLFDRLKKLLKHIDWIKLHTILPIRKKSRSRFSLGEDQDSRGEKDVD
jgi:hypothetical protein